MSLATGTKKGWSGPRASMRCSRGFQGDSVECEPALPAATNQNYHTEGTSVEILTVPNTVLTWF